VRAPSALFADTITVYNCRARRGEGGGVKREWGRTVIRGARWREGVERSRDANGVAMRRRAVSVTIPADAAVDGGKAYVEPEAYAALSGGGRWTLDCRGSDIIVYGECPREITEGYGITALKKEFPRQCLIAAASDNRGAPFLKHWKARGE
jgi:hypothetical protein